MVYYAKSKDEDLPVTVSEHCDAVAELARTYGEGLGIGTEAYLCGLMHDFGKYSDLFQDVLRGKRIHVDHAVPGAAMLGHYRQLSEVVAGHHTGLKPYESLAPMLSAIVGDTDSYTTPEGKEASICGKDAFSKAQGLFQADHPGFVPPQVDNQCPDGSWKGNLSYMLDTRMLYSCQVDADYTVSGGQTDPTPMFAPKACLQKLESCREQVGSQSKADPRVNAMRDRVYQDAGEAGQRRDPFLTLTAPTGSGKTFAMLKFALERCLSDPSKQRVIFVLPFLSLCDQVEADCRKVFPDVVVDHSQTGDGQDMESAERWTASCIITTTVQFFGSLWSDRPGDCRKLHRIANSVVLFDEIQALPHHICRFAMQSLKHLSFRYGTCILLSTATQPAYGFLPELDWDASEVVRDVDGLFSMAQRTGLTFHKEPMSMAEVAKAALEYPSACIIVNVKRYARQVYEVWKSWGIQNIFLLYTNLCPEHRREVLEEIHTLQADGKPVYVAATQCVEAGVDLDFHQVFRMLAPLTSLIQSAGRQNRNGRFPHGDTVVFEPVRSAGSKPMYPGADYEAQALHVKELVDAGFDVNSLTGIREYYRRLFTRYQEHPNLLRALQALDYQDFSRQSALIKDSGCRVIVPYGDMWQFWRLQNACVNGTVKKKDLTGISGISVQCYDQEQVGKHCAQLVIHNRARGTVKPLNIWILLLGHEGCYRDDLGLHFEKEKEDEWFII